MGKKLTSADDIFDFRNFFYLVKENWYYFVLSVALFMILAYAYVRYSPEYYRSSIEVLIQQDETNLSAAEMIYQNTMYEQTSSIEDEKSLFTSYPLIFETVSELGFDIGYFIVGNVKTSETYESPIRVELDVNDTEILFSFEFRVRIIDDNNYLILCEQDECNNQYSFGEKINIKGQNFIVYKNLEYNIQKESDILVRFYPLKKISRKYQSNVVVQKKDKSSNLLVISVLEQDQKKGVVFLNHLVHNFMEQEVEKKKKSYDNMVLFIAQEINKNRDSLNFIRGKIENYRKVSGTPDIGLKTQDIYKRISTLESELYRFSNKENYYAYLEEYIDQGKDLKDLRAPSTYGINNPNLTDLISKMVQFQTEKTILEKGGQYNNPSIADFNLQIDQSSNNIYEIISNSRKSNNKIIDDLDLKISIAKSELSALPAQQTVLDGLLEKQKAYIDLDKLLADKLIEAELKSSSVESSLTIAQPATYFGKRPVYPDYKLVYSISLLVSFLLPLLIILLIDLLSVKIMSYTDLEKLTEVNLIGIIGRNYSGNKLLTKVNPRSSIFESFRSLRSNIDHKYFQSKSLVYVCTSSVSGEGKTFLAENLAITYANSKLKTLLIGADLRKPKLYSDFSKENSKGLSTYLGNDHSFEEISSNTDLEYLDVIVSGPIPDDPAMLFVGDLFKKLIQEAKSKYDRVIIDTPPLGLVADAYSIMEFSDVNLYVVRQSYTHKDSLRFLNSLHEKNRVSNLNLVFNDVSGGGGVYGYGKYGYGSYGYGSYINNNEYFNEEK